MKSECYKGLLWCFDDDIIKAFHIGMIELLGLEGLHDHVSKVLEEINKCNALPDPKDADFKLYIDRVGFELEKIIPKSGKRNFDYMKRPGFFLFEHSPSKLGYRLKHQQVHDLELSQKSPGTDPKHHGDKLIQRMMSYGKTAVLGIRACR